MEPMPEDKRLEIVSALKKKWEDVNQKYQYLNLFPLNLILLHFRVFHEILQRYACVFAKFTLI